MAEGSDAEESSEEGGTLELMPLIRATGDRVLTGITSHALLQHCPLGFSVYEGTLSEGTLSEAAKACRELKAAKPKVSQGEKYSAGETYWVGVEDEPVGILERLAKEIFVKHTADIEPENLCGDLSGAEYWAVVCRKEDDVGPHFDKCYFLEGSHRVNLHPLIGTVTYLSSIGAPTVVTGACEDYVPCFRAEQECARRSASKEHSVPYVVSYPQPGKHITFDGQLLHFADAALALDSKSAETQRVALLVNVWANYRPKDAQRARRCGEPEGVAQKLMDFGTRGQIVDAERLKPGLRRAISGGGLRFEALFAKPDKAGSFWYDRKFCLTPEEPAAAPKKRKKGKRQLLARRRVEREVLELLEQGLAVESSMGFLTTAFAGRDEQRPEGLV